jgi:hypothetical protein
MSDTTGGGDPRLARRWQSISDVAIGVALFLALLFPAMREASTGTLGGLGWALLLMLLDVVVLVLLARYMTNPERFVPRLADPPAVDRESIDLTGPALSRDQAAAMFDEAGAPRDVPRLTVTDTGISIRQGAEATAHANLAWSDCAAVVFSQVAPRGGPRFTYLQFVAVHEGRIRRGPRDRKARDLSRVLGLTESAAAMVWVAPPQLVQVPPLVLAYVDKRHPRVRIVRPDVLDEVE